jgi:hypothetical protein
MTVVILACWIWEVLGSDLPKTSALAAITVSRENGVLLERKLSALSVFAIVRDWISWRCKLPPSRVASRLWESLERAVEKYRPLSPPVIRPTAIRF